MWSETLANRMITGYNTDVRHNEVVLHVQTEDKGESNPYIESLVYVGGQVLAARRASYTDLLEAGHGAKAVIARMEKQHRAMIAAIRRGKLDGKLAELLGEQTVEPSGPGVPPEAAAADAAARAGGAVPAGKPAATPSTGALPLPGVDDGDRTLDQVILDYLSSEADQEQLILMLDSDTDLEVGQAARLQLRAASSRSGKPVVGAKVTVRMISTVAEPRTLTSGATGNDGGLQLRFDIPDLGRGTAALIISANSDYGRAELKQLL